MINVELEAVIDVMDVTVQESDGVARVPIVMSKANANSVNVNVSTMDVTADSNDYVGINTVVTFPAGSTTQYVDVIIKQDNVYEGAETFKVIISNIVDVDGSTVIGKGVGIVTILDDDLAPKIRSITSATVSEGNSATHLVTLTNGSKFPTSVNVLITNNGANIGGVSTIVGGVSSSITNPYITNTIVVGAGLTSFNVKVDTVKDGIYRGTSRYVVSASIDGNVISGNGTVTDEKDRPKVGISSASAKEGDNLVFYVYLNRNTLVKTVIPYRLEHVTTTPANISGEVLFTNGVTYDRLSGNITIPAGIRSFEIVIPTVDDGTVEGLETLKVVVDGVVGIGSIANRVIDPEVPNNDSDPIVTVNVIDVDTYGLDEAELKANNMMVVGVDNKYDAQVEDLDELDITVAKKEYTIVGDDIYIPQFYDDAPQWMKDLVSLVVDVSMTTNSTKLINDLNKMLQEFAVSYVPLNQYTQSIFDLSTEDTRLNGVIETLNSNFNNGLSKANAQIIDLKTTKASKTEVVAQVIQTLSAQLQDPDSKLGATVVSLDQAITTEQTARARSFDALTASIDSTNGEITANAEVLETALAYVGIDPAGGSTGTGLLADVKILQKQNDGVIETVTGTYDVMIGVENPNNNTSNDELDVTKEPYKSWRNADAIAGGIENRARHVGDVYIKYSTAEHGYKTYERAYKFIRTSVDNTSPYSTDTEGFTWALIVDTDAQNAYVAALNALDLADNKRRVFTATPSGPYDKGDLWTKATARGSVLYRANTDRTSGFLATEWTEADDAALKDFEATVYEPKISMLETQIDSQISYFYNHVATTTTQVTTQLNTWKSTWTTPELKAAHHGDIGIFTKIGTGGEAYAYSRGTDSWVLITDNAILKALMSAATAQATADNVVVSYYAIRQDTQPAVSKLWFHNMKVGNELKYVLQRYEKSDWVNVDVKQGDTLTTYDTATKDTSIYLYHSDNWITETENGIVASSEAITTLTANLGETDKKVGGHTEQLSTVDARIVDGVASVETKWAYNSTVKINGVYKKSGFGLSTNYTSGSGTEVSPYVSEFWIDASRLKFTNSNQTGQVAPFTIDATGTTPKIAFNGTVNFSNVDNNPTAGNLVTFSWYANSDILVDMKKQGWTNYSGSGETYLSLTGLKVGNNNGNDQQFLIYDKSIPLNPNKRYKVTVEAQQTAGTGTAYFGFAGRNYNDKLWVNSSGSDSTSSQFYFISGWDIPTTMTTKKSDYWSIGNLVEGSDYSIRTDVAYYRPLMLVNYSGLAGTTIIKSFKIEEYEPAINIDADINANNNEFAQKLGFTNFNAMTSNAQLGKTLISGGYINTGLVIASSIKANSVSADRLLAGTNATTVWTGGGLVSSNFNGNPYGNIGNPTQGFRLSSNAAGTSTDPNIYGAYIKGGVIAGSTFVGSLTETSVYNNFNAAAPGHGSWKSIVTFTAYAPNSGEAFKLTACLTFGATGGNWPDIRFKVLFNNVEVLEPVQIGSLYSGADMTVFIKSDTKYTNNVFVEIQALQNANGYVYPQTSSRISCMTLGTAV